MPNSFSEQPITFTQGEYNLHGVFSMPEKQARTAVVIVVGGPQFRIGSHRQFVLLARYLAEQGIMVLRFDYSGMGYSEGPAKGFYEIDDDILAALDLVYAKNPDLEKVFLWGLCDAAAALAFFAHSDRRVNGVVLLNPWVRSEESHSKILLSEYYFRRLFDLAKWKELLISPKKIINAAISFIGVILSIVKSVFQSKSTSSTDLVLSIEHRKNEIADAMFEGLSHYEGKICLILSGNDLTAMEFEKVLDSSGWLSEEQNQAKTTVHRIADATHTFPSAKWRSQVEQITVEFVV